MDGGCCVVVVVVVVVVAPLETAFYLHKRFRNSADLIPTTQTFSSNSSAPDDYYNVF